MDSFDEIQNLISEDKLQKADRFFYSKIKQRIDNLENSQFFVFKIKKSHIILSIAAGLLLGLFIGNIVQHQLWENKKTLLMENILNNNHLDEKSIDCEAFEMATYFCRKECS